MQYAPPIDVTLTGRGDCIRLANLADLHIGSSSVDYELLQRDINYIAKTPNCYAILAGDCAQFIGHLDKRFDAKALTEEALASLGNLWIWQCKKVAEYLAPIKHKILASVPGNHEQKGGGGNMDVHRQIWSELGLDMRYCLTAMGSVRLRVFRKGSAKHLNCDVLIHHGRGAARTEGAKKNVLVSLLSDFPHWDVYFTGHSHTKDIYEPEEFRPNIDHTDSVLVRRVGVRSGTYEKAYEAGHTTYAERQAYRPHSLGALGVKIRRRAGRDGNDEKIDVRVWDLADEPNIDDYWPKSEAKKKK